MCLNALHQLIEGSLFRAFVMSNPDFTPAQVYNRMTAASVPVGTGDAFVAWLAACSVAVLVAAAILAIAWKQGWFSERKPGE